MRREEDESRMVKIGEVEKVIVGAMRRRRWNSDRKVADGAKGRGTETDSNR